MVSKWPHLLSTTMPSFVDVVSSCHFALPCSIDSGTLRLFLPSISPPTRYGGTEVVKKSPDQEEKKMKKM